jgi:hypothetical protein
MAMMCDHARWLTKQAALTFPFGMKSVTCYRQEIFANLPKDMQIFGKAVSLCIQERAEIFIKLESFACSLWRLLT